MVNLGHRIILLPRPSVILTKLSSFILLFRPQAQKRKSSLFLSKMMMIRYIKFSFLPISGGSSSGRIGTFQSTDLAGTSVSPAVPAVVHQTLETVQQALRTMSSPQTHERSCHGQAVHYRSTDLIVQTCPEDLRKRNEWLDNIEDALVTRSSGIRWKERQVSLNCVPDGQPWTQDNIVNRTLLMLTTLSRFILLLRPQAQTQKGLLFPSMLMMVRYIKFPFLTMFGFL